MELKTLKDLPHYISKFKFEKIETPIKAFQRGYPHFLFIGELRQEAIKWIKELKKEIVPTKDEIKIKDIKEIDKISLYILFKEKSIENRARIEWIKYFFNITEEDLNI